MKPRKWNREIKAWADGKIIQRRIIGTETWTDENPSWPQFGSLCLEFRIKPEEPEWTPKPGDLICGKDYPEDEYSVDVFKEYKASRDYPFRCKWTVWKEIKLHPIQQERDRYRNALEEIAGFSTIEYDPNIVCIVDMAKNALNNH